ncbi:MAG TPA: glycine betaine ABC transporter substrate-binding protein [Solirubrobacteraceae bacterium]
MRTARLVAWGAAAAALGLAGCGSSSQLKTSPVRSTTQTSQLPGTGRPAVTIGDKNFTEQFVLGELYYEALKAQGFPVLLNRNIGPTEVTLQALQSGRLGMYPEYIDTWNSAVAGDQRTSRSLHSAYETGQRYAVTHGLALLNPTPFSDTDAIGVGLDYAVQNGLSTIRDLRKVAQTLTFGAPPQFQQDSDGLPTLEQAYGFVPASFKPLEIGGQYQALDQGVVHAADVNTTDGQLTTGNYVLLKDPQNVLGWGNVVPVVSAQVLQAEGPAFAATINRVSKLLTLQAIRQLNAAVDVYNEDPAAVAQQFLAAHGLAPAGTG